ncbi:substrate-binding periplasmic protein [Desulforegula conservatrix]|uniref:substrate-binding periplasmic protein n=1 Tax=Desulforegula conservatrix TaxID=153026 RepID=UPI0004146CC8|nr:transporter substrate-binding domain-containing protein [Desulforegula conservatrix]
MKTIFSTMIVFLFFFDSSFAETKLKIGTDEWPPYEYVTGLPGNECMSGFSTDVILLVLKKMNVIPNGRIEQFPWARGEKMVIDGSLDMLYTAATSEKRAKIVHYPSEPIVESAWSLFIRSEDSGKLKYESLGDLKGKRIGVVRAYAYTPEFRSFIEAEQNYEEVAGDDQNVRKLMYRRIDYIVMDYGNGLYLIDKMNLTGKIVPLKKPIAKISLYPIFSRNTVEKEFVDRFSDELKAFKATPEYKKIYDRYFSVSGDIPGQ